MSEQRELVTPSEIGLEEGEPLRTTLREIFFGSALGFFAFILIVIAGTAAIIGVVYALFYGFLMLMLETGFMP